MGMNLFANIKYQENINRHANFHNFPNAMLMLFRCVGIAVLGPGLLCATLLTAS